MMDENDWNVLGLAPTKDLVAIKKAYALKLRVTRPEDDAAAYQALRGAYERAQLLVRWSQEALAEASHEAPDNAAAQGFEQAHEDRAPEEVATAAEPHRSIALEPDIAAWVASLEQCRSGNSVLVLSHWITIQAQLNDVPLHRQVEASARFADLVIAQPLLPLHIVQELAQHFAWRTDFRAARQLGLQRAQALQQALDLRYAHDISDPEVLREFAPLLHLQRLRVLSNDLSAFVFAMRMGDPLMRQLSEPEGRRLRRLDPAPEVGLSSYWLLFWAGVARAGVLAVLLAGLLQPAPLVNWVGEMTPHLPEDMVAPALFKLLFLLATLVALPLACLAPMWLLSGIGLGLGRLASLGRRRFPRYGATGLALLGAAAGPLTLGAVPDAWLYAVVALIAVGALLNWPSGRNHGAVALAAMGAVFAMLSCTQLKGQSYYAALAWLTLWVFLGCQLYENRPVSNPAALFFRPITNSLAICDMYGYKLGMTPAFIACAVVSQVSGLSASNVFVCWVFSILALAWLQRALTRWALREVARQ